MEEMNLEELRSQITILKEKVDKQTIVNDINLSQHQGLSNESVLCIRWSKYWSFNFCISPSNEYSGLISLSID